MAGLLDWMDGVVGRMDELVIRDPKSLPIEEQCSKCKVCSCRRTFLSIGCIYIMYSMSFLLPFLRTAIGANHNYYKAGLYVHVQLVPSSLLIFEGLKFQDLAIL